MLFFIHVRFQDTITGLITKNNIFSNFTSNNSEQKMKVNTNSNIVNNKN